MKKPLIILYKQKNNPVYNAHIHITSADKWTYEYDPALIVRAFLLYSKELGEEASTLLPCTCITADSAWRSVDDMRMNPGDYRYKSVNLSSLFNICKAKWRQGYPSPDFMDYNGSSAPWIVDWLLGLNAQCYQDAFLLHDTMYNFGTEVVLSGLLNIDVPSVWRSDAQWRMLADVFLFCLLRASGMSKFKAKLVFHAVSLLGDAAYLSYTGGQYGIGL